MKAVALLSDDQGLLAYKKRLDEVAERSAQRIAFLRKQAEDECKAGERESKQIWEEIEAYLVLNGNIPASYDSEKQALRIDVDAGVVYVIDREKAQDCGPTCVTGLSPEVARAIIKALEKI